MDLIVRLGIREERVRVRRVDGGFEVALGDRTYHVDAGAARGGLHSLRIDGAQHEVAVHRADEDVYWVSTGQHSAAVEVVDPLTHLASQTRGGKGGKRRQRVNAYMPGRVVALLAEEGQEVAAGQGIVVLEAMKMENEIGAEHNGRIGKIFVQPGQAVEMGNPLFELE
ncbi:MAG TPA: biotin/lipoyl-containing protein [Thermoanaerobaculia bacterium]|jgi:biotin carboxyl carrier protein|nr:biotin/lipoyl-containing protein [Thermoanaerobaculia bacterium]